MFHRHQWHIHPDSGGQRPGPLPGAAHHHLAFDEAARCMHPTDPPGVSVNANPRYRAILDDPHPRHPRALGKALGDVGRVGLPVGRQKRRADQIVDIHQRPQILGLARGQQMHVEAKGMRRCGLTPDLGPAVGVAGQSQAAVHLPPRRNAGFRLQPVIEIDRIAQQLGDIGIGAQLPDQPRRMERGARCQFGAFQQNRVGPAQLGQMIGGGTADDAAADDNGPRRGGKILHGVLSFG